MIVSVVGAGVIGLTTAVVLAERGHTVEVLAAELPTETTSAMAGAIWGPYRAGPPDAVDRWSKVALAIFARLAAIPGTGVRLTSGREVARREVDPPRWRQWLADWRWCTPDELPPGVVTGWRFTAPILDMPEYLDYLCRRLRGSGGELRRATVDLLDHAGAGSVVVNCSGMGARLLAGDPSMVALAGQHVVVANPGLTEFYMEDVGPSADLIGVYPQGDRVVLGGTAVAAADDHRVDPVAARAIISRCARVFPELAEAPVLGHAVGVRPLRPTVRLEACRLPSGRWCVHNYGHGGGGVTLAWGCALEVAELVESSRG